MGLVLGAVALVVVAVTGETGMRGEDVEPLGAGVPTVRTDVTIWPGGPAAPGLRNLRREPVLVLGDSLTQESRDRVEAGLLALGALPTIIAENGRSTDLVNRHARLHQQSVVVVALGSNDLADGWNPIADQARIEAAVAALQDRDCVAWVLPAVVTHPWFEPPSILPGSFEVRAAIVDTARDAGFQIVDWTGAASKRPEWYQPDGIHHNALGQEAYAATIVEATRVCAAQVS